jgi:hypothetical protein
LCALFVSFLSIVLTIVSVTLQQIHNYKSLTPIASLPIGDYENLIQVSIKNTGVGPLIVDKFSVFRKNNEESPNIIDWMPVPPKGIYWETFQNDLTGLCIPPNESIAIIKLSGDLDDKKFSSYRNRVRQALIPLKVKVIYKDIYGRKMPAQERDLSWFGRHQEN